MPKNGKNRKANGKKTGIKNGNRSLGGPAPSPGRIVTKKFMYNEFILMNNSTNSYAFYSAAVTPDITKAEGAIAQFSAYELWRLKRVRASIQLAPTPSNINNFSPITWAAATSIFTAPDYGKNEQVSGKELLQYQNCKRTSPSLNGFKCIVDTGTRINCSLGTAGNRSNLSSTFIMPPSTWINTEKYNSSFYSGYQLFIQSPGFENTTPSAIPGFTLQTELTVEFMQPAFQSSPSSFGERVYDITLEVIPDSSDPDSTRKYVFERLTAERNANGDKEYNVHLVRDDGQPGSLTYTGSELYDVYATGGSGQYFNNRRAIYSGPTPESYLDVL